MMADGDHDVRVACLSGILDLQRVCQRENLQFSPETNKFLVYQTLKKVGPWTAQKLISKLVERGDLQWETDEDFEVETVIDHCKEEGVDFYLIKWKGWSNSHNSWEPAENLQCPELIKAFHSLPPSRLGGKRRLADIANGGDNMKLNKKRRVDEIFAKLVKSPIREIISPLHLLSLSSPKKGKLPQYKGLITGDDQKIRKVNTGTSYTNPRTKGYKQKRLEVQKALKEWEKHLNSISTDPAPISVENNMDLEGPPENFEYINDYREGEGITIPQDPLVGCECDDCWDTRKGCCPAACGAEFAYYKYKRVKVLKGTPIYECNKRCKCGPDCPNRVVQHGRQCKVCVFRTHNGRGWGVKALQKIKRGTFVMEYVGEVITNEEAERRGKVYDAECRTYLFDLDYNDGDCPYTVDAGYYGNVSHFVNHSCDPNLEVFGVWINTLDPRLPRIALFSKKDILKGEELTFDYMMTGDTTLQTVSQVAESQLPPLQPPHQTPQSDDTTSEYSYTSQDPDSSSTTTSRSPSKTGSSPSKPTGGKSPSRPESRSSSSKEGRSPSKANQDQLPARLDPSLSSKSGSSKSPSKSMAEPDDKNIDADDTKSDISDIPNPVRQQYRMVCQCGAANCRKYLF
ncbi:histone-lysine N-methyltransferase SUV39H2-like [Haliotis cracherodii]|uniref:histone-lysine N-methyltransferase SUV39H2-like n=1 Tax=Haliotis cracherodii TaxID=6455 RepID=UPI0039ED2003